MATPKLLLIDGNNMAHRVFWAGRKRNPMESAGNLESKGREVDLIYGFFRQLVALHKLYPEHLRVIAWDGGAARRKEETRVAVEAGLIPSGYKATRKRDDADPDYMSLCEQMAEVKDAMKLVRCVSVQVKGYEGDDILYTYAKAYGDCDGADIVVVSSDKDFYQVLSPTVRIYDAMSKELWTAERFEMEFGFPSSLWVDAGAIMGEVGTSKDNIFGVDGWGPVTTYKHVQDHGGIDNITAYLRSLKKRSKKEQVFLDQLARLDLARSLKQMDVVPGVPKLRCGQYSSDALKAYFLEWNFVSLMRDIGRLI